MNIDWVIPCRFAEVHDNLATIVGAGIDTLWVSELPSPVQVVVAIRVLAMAEELGAENRHSLKTIITSPHGDVVGEIGGELALDGNPARPDFLAGAVIPSVLQFEVTEEGTYMIEFVFDEASKSLPMHIVLGSP